jgi:RNA-splicing ligase RtcB
MRQNNEGGTMASMSEINPAWKTRNALKVTEAACLMAGIEPTKIGFDSVPPHFRDPKLDVPENLPFIEDVHANFLLLLEAINNKGIETISLHQARPREGDGDKPRSNERIAYKYEWFYRDKDDIGREDLIVCDAPDWSLADVHRDHLKAWLVNIGHHDKFFNPESGAAVAAAGAGGRAFMDPSHKRYSPKLAMAVTAWEEYEGTEEDIKQKDIEKLIKKKAKTIPDGLGTEEGQAASAIEKSSKAIATVVNWRRPGAPRGQRNEGTPPPTESSN